MGTFLVIIILLFIAWPVIVRLLRPVLQRWAARKAEDYIRRAAGMPPRDKGHERRQRQQETSGSGYASRSSRRRAGARQSEGPLIPKEYAVDVEYVEIKDYSANTVVADDPAAHRQRVWHESQVSDAEYVMLKPGKRRG